MTKLVQKIASLVQARLGCVQTGNAEWERKHKEKIYRLVKEHMPSGSGFDDGTAIDLYRSTPERLFFDTQVHHMNENGYYDGWTTHGVSVTPSLLEGIHLEISGRDRNDIKDFIHEAFFSALTTEVPDVSLTVTEPDFQGGIKS